jgi:hypothetical protein
LGADHPAADRDHPVAAARRARATPARLRRHGYDVRTVAELASAKTSDIQALLRGELEATRTREITHRLQAAGLPI